MWVKGCSVFRWQSHALLPVEKKQASVFACAAQRMVPTEHLHKGVEKCCVWEKVVFVHKVVAGVERMP